MAVKPVTTHEEAFGRLINECPAFEAAWLDLNDWTSEVGIYTVFTHIVMPFLHYALEDGYERRHLRTEAPWRKIPDVPSQELDDLLEYLYGVLDCWASSPNEDIRHAVFIELAAQGSGQLSVQDLTQLGGPAIGRMVAVGNWSLPS